MIEITALDNGAHRNQTYPGRLPEGWAVIPDDMEIPDTFPFVNIEVEEIEGVMTVTRMTAGVVPEPPLEPEREPSVEERVATLEAETEELNEALNMILEGKVE
jgi:hypothetical protein